MRNEEKNKWKQKSSNLPLGIKAKVGLAVKVGAVALGFHVWGIDFIWVVLGFTFCMTSCGAFSPALFLSWL